MWKGFVLGGMIGDLYMSDMRESDRQILPLAPTHPVGAQRASLLPHVPGAADPTMHRLPRAYVEAVLRKPTTGTWRRRQYIETILRSMRTGALPYVVSSLGTSDDSGARVTNRTSRRMDPLFTLIQTQSMSKDQSALRWLFLHERKT